MTRIINHTKATRAWRFWSRVEFTGPFSLTKGAEGHCWVWRSTTNNHGYGVFWSGERPVYAHRWAYELANGPITAGLQADHLCRRRNCLRPSHIEPVTPRVNTLRGMSPGALTVRLKRCQNDHEMTPENTGTRRNGSHICRACDAARSRAYYARKQAAKATTERTAA